MSIIRVLMYFKFFNKTNEVQNEHLYSFDESLLLKTWLWNDIQ